jgi:hypothetical protein
MKATGIKSLGIPLTDQDARVFHDFFDALEGFYGAEAQSYMRQYLKLWPKYLKLQKSGVKVRMSPLRFGRRPLLIIDR